MKENDYQRGERPAITRPRLKGRLDRKIVEKYLIFLGEMGSLRA